MVTYSNGELLGASFHPLYRGTWSLTRAIDIARFAGESVVFIRYIAVLGL